jgi:hypothetical protein
MTGGKAMNLTRVAVGVLVGIAVLAGGLIAAKPVPSEKPRPPVLPSWAPKRPSQEFLRAAKVLKPIPPEVQSYRPTYVPAWELFGSLTDKQAKQFLTPKQVSQPIAAIEPGVQKYLREKEQANQVGDKLVYYSQNIYVEVKSFSPRQRVLFDSLLSAWREESKGTPEEDLLVLLYRLGAKKDLSNVQIGFSVRGRHAVDFGYMVVKQFSTASGAGEMASGGGIWVAQI